MANFSTMPEDSVTLAEASRMSMVFQSVLLADTTMDTPTSTLDNPTSTMDNVTSMDTILNATDIDSGYILRQLNSEFANLMLPAIIYLAVLMAFGIVGNVLVLYVYIRKFKHNTTRSFVIALAVFDLISCTVAIPGEVIDLTHNYTFGSYIVCKLLRTVNSFSAFASGMTLFVVAVDRYKRICTPLGKHISTKSANLVLLACCVVAMVLSAPASVLYGSRTVKTSHSHIIGSDCSTQDKFLGTLFPLIYNSIQFLFFAVGALGLMALYSLIGRRIWRHRRFKVNGQPLSIFTKYSDSGSETSPMTDDGNAQGYIAPSGPVPGNTKEKNMRKLRPPPVKLPKRTSASGMSSPSSPESMSPTSPTWLLPKPDMRKVSMDHTSTRKVSMDHTSMMRKLSVRRGTTDRRQSFLPNITKRESNARRTTLMLFLITLIFILSFLPHLVLMAIKAMDKASLSGSGDIAELVFNIFIRSYFINSVANPIVYGLCCQKFRVEVMKILRCKSGKK